MTGTVGRVGWTVSVTGSTAMKLHRHLVRATAGQPIAADIAEFIAELATVRAAWEAGAMKYAAAASASGHADTVEVVAAAGLDYFEDGVTTVEAGRLLGRSPRSAQRLAANGRVASRRVGQSLLLSRTDVLAVLEEQRDAEAG